MAHRHTQFTLNEVERFDSLKGKILKKNPAYVIACREEAPLTGHEHIHIYVQWGKQVRVNAKKNNWEGAHIEKCNGTPEENKAYIEKGGDVFWEHGEMKTNVATRFPTIKEAKGMTNEELDELPMQYYNVVNKIKASRPVELDDYHKTVTVIFYSGPSGIGKTRTACQYMKTIGVKKFDEVKYVNGFWQGVSGECDTCLYDDFRDTHMSASEFINFIDYNVHNLNVKGGNFKNKYRHIFITSIQDPEKIYRNTPEEYKQQWLRRIEIRYLN